MYYDYDPNRQYEFGETPPGELQRVPAFTSPPQAPEPPKKKRRGWARIIAACLICALLGGAAGGAVVSTFIDTPASDAPASDTLSGDADTLTLGADEELYASLVSRLNVSDSSVTLTAEQVYELGCPSVVGVSTEIVGINVFGQTTSSAATGTGFVISADGYILTNCHVIEGYSSVVVTLYSGESYPAEVIAYDDQNDVAVLKISETGLTPVTIGSSSDISVGETVYTIGNPLGELTYTMTSGIVSALDRLINTEEGTPTSMFQIDAAVNSGNSGGPVFNSSGEVIGVVTAKYASTGVEGLGFALPTDDVMDIVAELLEHGYVTGRPYFGITVITVSEREAEYYNMVIGAYVSAIDENACAYRGGMRSADIITAINGEEVLSSSDVVTAKAQYAAGDTITVTVWRSGEYVDLSVTLDEEVPTTIASASDDSGQSQNPGAFSKEEKTPSTGGGY